MREFRNKGKKRICDVSEDGKVVEIRVGDHLTRIRVGPDGRLLLENIY